MSPMRAVLAAAVALAVTAATVDSSEAQADSPPPCRHDFCTEDELTLPGTPPTPPRPSDGGAAPVGNQPGAQGRQPRCVWIAEPPYIPGDGGPGAFPDPGTRPSEDAELIFEICDDEYTGRVGWSNPGDPSPAAAPAPAAVPTPEQLAATVRVRLVGDLPQPIAATSPPTGEPAVVNHPTFLAIANWTGTVTARECAFVLCVTVTATPQLTWTPGEPDTPRLTCTGGGTRFDPTGPTPQEQAARPGACAHAYEARTGITGRPQEWPGVATVTWTLTWTSTSGAGGDLPSITRSTDVPRAVDEVQAIVVR